MYEVMNTNKVAMSICSQVPCMMIPIHKFSKAMMIAFINAKYLGDEFLEMILFTMLDCVAVAAFCCIMTKF